MDVQEALLIATDGAQVTKALRAALAADGYGETGEAPLTRAGGAATAFSDRKRRFFFVSDFATGHVTVVEYGEMFEVSLVERLSRSLSVEAVWVALHESLNAWGEEEFEAGHLRRRALHPEEAFSDSADIDDVEYEGDATAEAFSLLEGLHAPEAFVGYRQIANGVERSPSLRACVHLAFTK